MLVLLHAPIVLAQATGEPPTGPAEPRVEQEETDRGPEAAAHDDPCFGGAVAADPALDRMRGRVYSTVCASSRWLDGFFGDSRDYTEVYGQTYGRAGVGVDWNERDDFGVDGFLRAKFPLPALGDRYNAIIGRDTEENFLDDDFDEATFLPGAFSDENVDSVWYAGINYGGRQGGNHRTDIGVGLQVSSPINPYVKFRYRYYKQPSDTVLLRFRATPFWENRDGLGITVAGDSDWTFTEGWMLRWANTATFAEATEGVRWKTRLALFQQLNEKSAMRYEAAVRGETDGIQPKHYGGKVSYRRSLWRDWFFLETSASLFWSRGENPDDDCDACIGAGVGFEIAFGDRYDSRLPEPDTSPKSEPAARSAGPDG